jgi:hypothetical protein
MLNIKSKLDTGYIAPAATKISRFHLLLRKKRNASSTIVAKVETGNVGDHIFLSVNGQLFERITLLMVTHGTFSHMIMQEVEHIVGEKTAF